MTARRRIVAALADGARAARAGEPLTACPYRRASSDRVEKLLGTLWCRAHGRLAPMPVDFGGAAA